MPAMCTAPHHHDFDTFGAGFTAALASIRDAILESNSNPIVEFRAQYANLNNNSFAEMARRHACPDTVAPFIGNFRSYNRGALLLAPYLFGVTIVAISMRSPTAGEITQLLSRLSAGDYKAEEQVLALVYKDLRRLARHYLAAERRDHTLQATALVHEAYLRINKQAGFQWKDRSHFFAIAARAMRRVLVDHARGVKAVKRGGMKLSLETAELSSEEQCADMLALNESLDRLALLDSQQARIVEMKFFGGLTAEEIAQILNISVRTVKRDWNHARAWLYGELTKPS
jgi:RNA polymerase sigma-70 factor (ECF subfamily)